MVSLYDRDNDDEDFFWVYIERKMDDRIVDKHNWVFDMYDDVFVEYWKFVRSGDFILLDKILQKDVFEN